MKQLRIFCLMALLTALVMSCGTTKNGIKVSPNKNDLVFNGASSIKGYNPDLEVLAMNADDFQKYYQAGKKPADDMISLLEERGNNLVLPDGKDGKDKVFFQVKDGTFVKDDYLWAIKSEAPDYKVNTRLLSQDKGGKIKAPSGGGESNEESFNIYGANIKATIKQDENAVFHIPCTIAFALNETEEVVTLRQYSYNNKGFKDYDLNGDDVKKHENEKQITVDLTYGYRFAFISTSGKFANLSPALEGFGKINLQGIKIVENKRRSDDEPFYVFEVISGGKETPKKLKDQELMDDNQKTDRTCAAYQSLKLAPCRIAKDSDYPNGWYSLDCCDVYAMDTRLFNVLVDWGAIGYDKDENANQSTVRISPDLFKSYCKNPALYNKYKSKVHYPSK